MKKTLFIMRGCPGSGKSTYVNRSLTSNVCSADDYFVNHNGVYVFDAEKLRQAHAYCQSLCLYFMKQDVAYIAIDNTNTRPKEMDHYMSLATLYGYEVQIIRMDADPEIAAARNTHGVPREKVLEMAARLEIPLPAYFPEETVIKP